jgi:hypothetical protein
MRFLPRRFHAAWQVLRPWITQAEARGATVKLIFFTQAKKYQYPDGENNMLNIEAEWEKELTDLLGPYGHTFVPPHIPSRWQTFGNLCCGMLGWCWEKLPKCVQTLVLCICGPCVLCFWLLFCMIWGSQPRGCRRNRRGWSGSLYTLQLLMRSTWWLF